MMLKREDSWKHVTKCPDKQKGCTILLFKLNRSLEVMHLSPLLGQEQCVSYTHMYLPCARRSPAPHCLLMLPGTLHGGFLPVICGFHNGTYSRVCVESNKRTTCNLPLPLLFSPRNVISMKKHSSFWELAKYSQTWPPKRQKWRRGRDSCTGDLTCSSH